jgi:hypothetical protein
MRILASLALLALLSGCSNDYIQEAPTQLVQAPPCPAFARRTPAYAKTAAPLLELTYAAVDKITHCASDVVSDKVLVTVSSITDSQHLDRSSPFGNVVADFARARLAQNHMAVSDEDEMFLGRDPVKLTNPHPLYAVVLTGTYGVGEQHVFVGLKLIRTDNAQILSAADFVVPRQGDVDRLLR